MSNSVKFTPAGGAITIEGMLTDDGGIKIVVSDTGLGIPEDMLERVLQPFGQVSETLTRNKEGTGLGLPLAKSFIELHDGIFDLTSKVGSGTTVTLEFPAERVVPRDE